MKRSLLYYLATPIRSHRNTESTREVEQTVRYIKNLDVAHSLTSAGWLVYSPFLHYRDMTLKFSMSNDWHEWEKRSLGMLERCDGVIALDLPDYQKSVGMNAELHRARQLLMPILWPVLPIVFDATGLKLNRIELGGKQVVTS